MSHIDDDISGGLTNGNYGRLPHEAMNRLNLNGGAGSEGSAPRRGDDGTEDGSDNFVENPLYGRGTFAQDQGLAPEYILLHRVICDNRAADGEDHQDHPAQSDYLDVPRLFKNDTRGSALRGAKPLLNPREFWEDHPEVSAIVTREYRCGSYHRQLKGSFRIIAQVADRQTRNRLRPWLYRLDDDGPPAVNPTESITISETLSASLMTLALGNQLGEWSQERDLMAPYDYFYHFRESLRRSSQLQLPTWDRQELEVLLDYIDETQGKKFDKVDDVFAHGQVHRDIFSKLFRPNELVVTNQEGHPRAYIAEKVYMNDRRAALERPTITLECWAWEFDGSFRKKTTQLQVSWPQTHHATISVTSLLAWPLRLEKPEMEKRLEDRGKEFWTCRKRRLISYYSPTPTIFELQVTNPKYMIDYSTHRQMHPNKFPQQLVPKDEMLDDGVDIDSDEPPKYPFCMLLPPTMLGYAFHDKKWSKFLNVKAATEADTYRRISFDRARQRRPLELRGLQPPRPQTNQERHHQSTRHSPPNHRPKRRRRREQRQRPNHPPPRLPRHRQNPDRRVCRRNRQKAAVPRDVRRHRHRRRKRGEVHGIRTFDRHDMAVRCTTRRSGRLPRRTAGH